MGWSSNRPTDYFAVGIQASVNTEATTFRFPKHLTGSGFSLTPDVADEREGGGGQEVALSYKKMIKADGNILVNARGVGALYTIIDGALGLTATMVNASAAGAAGADIPTSCVKPRMVLNPTLPYLTLEQRYSDQIERVSNAKVNQLTIDGAAGLPMKVSAQFSGAGTVYQRDPAASSLTAVYDAGDPLYFARGSYLINGPTASGAKLTKFKVTVARHLDEAIQTTDLYRDDLIELTSDLNFDCTLKYEDRLLYQGVQFGGGSTVPIPISSLSFNGWAFNGNTPTTGVMPSNFRAMRVALNNLLAKTAAVNKLEPDGKTVYIDVACTSIKQVGATDSLVIELTVPSAAYTEFP